MVPNNCRGCGAVPLADATFCHECGMQLISSQPTEKPVSHPEPKPEPEYMMLCVAGESALHSLYDGGTLDWSTLKTPAKQATLERARVFLTAALDVADPQADGLGVIRILKTLATFYEYSGKPAEAEQCYRRALDLQSVVQPDSMETANTIGRLIRLVRTRSSDSELQALLTRQLSIEQLHGPVHGIRTAGFWGVSETFIGGFDVWLAIEVYARQGNILEAQNLWKRVLDGEQVRGEVRRKYVEFLRGIGEDRQAEELHQKLERDGLLEAARQEIEMERRRLESAAQSMVDAEEASWRARH